MPAAPSTETVPLTADEFGRRPDPGYPEELAKGRVIAMSVPDRRHGQVCNKTGRILGNFAEEHDLGHVLSNDAGIITERDPDTVRGADVAYYSYSRLPRGPLARNYGPEIPELVVEVRSKSDRWPRILSKAAEYLDAGVSAVIVLDVETSQAHILTLDSNRILEAGDVLTLPDLLPGFAVPVQRFFE